MRVYRRTRSAGKAMSIALIALVGLLCPVSSMAAGVEITDFRGETLRLDAPATRIVALAPHLVENLYSAGLGDRIVGAVSYSDYPPAARAIPEVGGYTNISLEAVVSKDPDLVVAWASGQGGDPATLARFEALGIPVYVDRPRQLEDIARAIRDLGVLGDTREVADAAASRFERRLSSLRERYSTRSPVSVFYQVWDDPLQTLAGEQFVGQVIRLCGGRNIFADAVSLAPKVGIESVLERDPQAIVASGMGDERPDWLDDWRDWPGLQAVENDHLFFVAPDIIQRATMRVLDGATTLCRQLESVRRDKG
ncbi:putative vitamin B12 transport protein [Salinisphaera shabanensis E1L3A]|uniref:Vitamin B12 transport protein n=2 Tax=Salinisphaera shabanensis TaxID=180542 RepID=U2ELI3_9GAMM|nr:putative vitamin B12 transport protein [Salinisphaera shabanensis E1L3A]